MVLVTRKAASDEMVGRALAAVGHAAPHVPAGVARLDAGELCAWNSQERQPLAALRGHRALAVSGIGDPTAFEAQLAAAGVSLEPVRFPDHHHFRDSDVSALVTKGEAAGVVLCTLKDAVKLGPQWPPGAVSLWYVSQRVTVDRGADVLAGVIARLLDLRSVPQPHREGH
jgi:tetraacyldisaccharide 4'-kinase